MPEIIDAHVHFYSRKDLQQAAIPPGYSHSPDYTLEHHLKEMAQLGEIRLIISVYMSIFPDAQHVFDSFEEMTNLKQQYGEIKMLGFLNADPQHAYNGQLDHPQVQGVRFLLWDTPVEQLKTQFDPDASDWQELFRQISKNRQHVLLLATSPTILLESIRLIPPEITIGVDHLGAFSWGIKSEMGGYEELLELAASRGNVYFKGPGYRTDVNPEAVVPFVRRLIEKVGDDKIILEATDAPNVGNHRASGETYRQIYPDAKSALEFTHQLANIVCQEPINGRIIQPNRILRENAFEIYGVRC
ncbi:MAG: amidohydrolase family protein [Symploca sp. SIO2D2]|nr:amidohydrolase family protein [Symploca sp. SIO2D2]